MKIFEYLKFISYFYFNLIFRINFDNFDNEEIFN